jgi:hypothetical protein
MPTTKKTSSTVKNSVKKKPVKKTKYQNAHSMQSIRDKFRNSKMVVSASAKVQDFLARRPHRSFRRTYRRDYERSLDMPGYIAFTHYVQKTLWSNKKVFIFVVLAYAVITVAVMNLSSEDLYAQMRETVNESNTGLFNGFWGEISKTGLLLIAGVTGSFNGSPTATQSQTQVYLVILGLMTWLTTVWLLRAILTGRKPKMRDGLYNAGAPIVPTFLVATVIVLQLLPLALALFGYNSAVASGLLEGGVEAMMFWSVAALLAILSLYWITTTLIALVVVTLPGMYPMQALRTAGDLVVGRRLRILMRVLWMALCVVLAWALIVIPIMLFDAWLKSVWSAIAWLPLVPLTWLVMGAITVIWIAGYIYLLYRRIVEDDALPA